MINIINKYFRTYFSQITTKIKAMERTNPRDPQTAKKFYAVA